MTTDQEETDRMYITDQDEFEAFIKRAHGSQILAIDTEFLRESTYYPKLCLLQFATDDEEVIVDPLAVKDLHVLEPLLRDPNVLKLFHAGRQDIEILLYEVGCTPTPLFDTQVAASLLGQAQQVGYGVLVQAVCGVKIRKQDTFTDWSARPLAESQVEYALQDVHYLPQMYRTMAGDLQKRGRLSWLDPDFAELSDPDTYLVDERERFRRLKHAGTLSRRQMAAAREMAAWREITARKRNVPRKWVMTDEQIVETCKREPRSISDLFMVRGMRERVCTADARELMELIVSALDSSPEAWPDVPTAGKSERNVDAEVDLLMSVVRVRARQAGVAVAALANHADLVKLARGHVSDVDIVKGWRRDIVGAELLDIMAGREVLSIRDGRISINRED